MPFSTEDFEDLMRNASLVDEVSQMANALFKLFDENGISPPLALGGMAFAIGTIMGHDGRGLKDLYPIIEAAYNLAEHRARGGKR